MKKALKRLAIIFISVILALALAVGGFFLLYTPTLTADMSVKTGEVTSGASGYLYGLAQPGVPSENMCESVDISSVSQKVLGGLQHPIGDVDDVYPQLESADYIVVYLQDVYSTWYYEQSNIEKMRADGTYDWQSFIKEDYFPQIEKAVRELSQTPYSDRVVYCLYNECDNGVWFGETMQGDWCEYGVYGEFNEVGEQNFFEAWKMTYDLVKSINKDALIGGPGYCDYEADELENFLKYCSENSCTPEIMIYHELSDYSIYFWQDHVANYRELEKKYNISELPIIVTEYGRMQDNGLPGKMLQYITQIEMTKVYGDNAYWRLANNLCDVAADDNSPNSNWWLYRRYADMAGQSVYTQYQDLFKSNFENAYLKYDDVRYTSQGFMGIVSITDDESRIDVICGGRDGKAKVKLKNLDKTALYSKNVKITVEEVLYKGLSGVVTSTVKLREYTEKLGSSLSIKLDDMDESSAYFIKIEPCEEELDYKNGDYIKRFEFEHGELLGNAYTYDSAYATTGEVNGMVGGLEQDGDGISVTVDIPKDGDYNLDFIFGNSNDGEFDENGRQNPDDRTFAVGLLEISGGNGDDISDLLILPNTIKSEYTDCYTYPLTLTKGKHTIKVSHKEGTLVLDSLLISESGVSEDISVLDDEDRSDNETKSFLTVVKEDGYYDITFDKNAKSIFVNDNEISVSNGNDTVYLMRGLNYIDVKATGDFTLTASKAENQEAMLLVGAYDLKLSGSARLKDNSIVSCDYIDGISCNSGSAELDVTAPRDGIYAITITYANNEEGGTHAYNVDLIERYVTIDDGSSAKDVYCRSTYSNDTYKTVTAFITLKAGENKITLTNSGNNKFNGADTYAPLISKITINEISR